jgi:hypothetical protein
MTCIKSFIKWGVTSQAPQQTTLVQLLQTCHLPQRRWSWVIEERMLISSVVASVGEATFSPSTPMSLLDTIEATAGPPPQESRAAPIHSSNQKPLNGQTDKVGYEDKESLLPVEKLESAPVLEPLPGFDVEQQLASTVSGDEQMLPLDLSLALLSDREVVHPVGEQPQVVMEQQPYMTILVMVEDMGLPLVYVWQREWDPMMVEQRSLHHFPMQAARSEQEKAIPTAHAFQHI